MDHSDNAAGSAHSDYPMNTPSNLTHSSSTQPTSSFVQHMPKPVVLRPRNIVQHHPPRSFSHPAPFKWVQGSGKRLRAFVQGQEGDWVTLDLVAKLRSSTSVDRLLGLGRREKVWRELTSERGAARDEQVGYELLLEGSTVPSAISSAERAAVVQWIWTFEPSPGVFPTISHAARYMAVTFFSLYLADAVDWSRSLDSSTGSRKIGAWKVGIAALGLGFKWETDFTGPLCCFSIANLLYSLRGDETDQVLTPRVILNTEISILRSPSIGYSFPTIPLYYLFELEVHVEYIRAMRVERGELWDKILQRTLMGLERATTDQFFLHARPAVLIAATLVLAVRTLDPLFLAAEDEYDIPETVDPQRASSFDLDDSSPISTPSTPTNCSTPNALLGDYALSASSSSPLVDQLDVHGSKSTSPLDSSISSASSSSSSSDSFKPQRRPTPSPSSQIRFLQDEVVELEKIFHVTLSESLAISMEEITRWVQWVEEVDGGDC